MASHVSLLTAAHVAILATTFHCIVQNGAVSVSQTLSAKLPLTAIKLRLQLDVDPAFCRVSDPALVQLCWYSSCKVIEC